MALNARLRITWPISTFSQLTRTGELAGTMSSFTPASCALRPMKYWVSRSSSLRSTFCSACSSFTTYSRTLLMISEACSIWRTALSSPQLSEGSISPCWPRRMAVPSMKLRVAASGWLSSWAMAMAISPMAL
ncbi:hypothetical protein D9M71_776560 [compost metagenome]